MLRTPQNISQLFRHMLDLLRSKRQSVKKKEVLEHLTLFTRGILFGEAFDVTDGDGRKTAGASQPCVQNSVPKRLLVTSSSCVRAVKHAREVRRCAQVLLDCRWFAKKFGAERRAIYKAHNTDSGEILVAATIAGHLKLQVRHNLQYIHSHILTVLYRLLATHRNRCKSSRCHTMPLWETSSHWLFSIFVQRACLLSRQRCAVCEQVSQRFAPGTRLFQISMAGRFDCGVHPSQ
jgi:hypothetical protein